MIGIDASPAMLAGARERAADAGVELDLRQGDMRELSLDEPTDLVICPFRSLLHLPTWADRACASSSGSPRRSVPGGRFAWNAFVFDPAIAAEIGGGWRDQSGVRTPLDVRLRRTTASTSTLESGATVSLWWVDASEWEGLVADAGLEVEALYGWFDRRPFDDVEPRVRLRRTQADRDRPTPSTTRSPGSTTRGRRR